MIRNTCPPFPAAFRAPFLKLGHDALNPSRLFEGVAAHASGFTRADGRFRRVHRGVFSTALDARFEHLKHLDGGAELSGGGRVHD